MWSLYQQDRQGAGLLIDEEGKQVEIFSRRWKIISKRDVNDADTGDMRFWYVEYHTNPRKKLPPRKNRIVTGT